MLSTCLKTAEIKYYEELFKNKKESTTKFWKTLGRNLQNRKTNKKNKINKIIIDGKILTDEKEIADGMNSFFCTIGENIANNVSRNNECLHSYRSYLSNKIEQTFSFSL